MNLFTKNKLIFKLKVLPIPEPKNKKRTYGVVRLVIIHLNVDPKVKEVFCKSNLLGLE